MATAPLPLALQTKAGFWTRAGAYILDSLIFTGPGIVVAIVGVTAGQDSAIYLLLLLILSVAWVVYFTYVWATRGQTPGMRAMNIRVVKTDGSRLTAGTAVVRYIGFVIASIPFDLGLLWVAWDRNKQGWHDKMAGTYVVSV